MPQYYFSLRQFQLIKCSFYIHNTMPYIHPRLDTRVRLFICALWSPAGKGLTSWLSYVVSYCEFGTLPLVSWVKYATRLYRFQIFAPLLTLILELDRIILIVKTLGRLNKCIV